MPRELLPTERAQIDGFISILRASYKKRAWLAVGSGATLLAVHATAPPLGAVIVASLSALSCLLAGTAALLASTSQERLAYLDGLRHRNSVEEIEGMLTGFDRGRRLGASISVGKRRFFETVVKKGGS